MAEWSVDRYPAYDHHATHHVQSYKSMSSSRLYVARPLPSYAPHNSCQKLPAEYCGVHKKPVDEASELAFSEERAGPYKSADWLVSERTPHEEC